MFSPSMPADDGRGQPVLVVPVEAATNGAIPPPVYKNTHQKRRRLLSASFHLRIDFGQNRP